MKYLVLLFGILLGSAAIGGGAYFLATEHKPEDGVLLAFGVALVAYSMVSCVIEVINRRLPT